MNTHPTAYILSDLKGHVALDRASWSKKSIWNRLSWNAYGLKYNDPQKYVSKLHGFRFTLRTITRSAILLSQKCDSTKRQRVPLKKGTRCVEFGALVYEKRTFTLKLTYRAWSHRWLPTADFVAQRRVDKSEAENDNVCKRRQTILVNYSKKCC